MALTASCRSRCRGGRRATCRARRWRRSAGAALTASTGHGASNRIRWALEPRISLPTGVRRRRPITMNSAFDLLRHLDQVLGRLQPAAGLPDLVRHPGRVEVGADLGQLGVLLRGPDGVRLLGPAGVDHYQPGVAQPGLLRRPLQRRPALWWHVAHDDRHRPTPVCRLWPARYRSAAPARDRTVAVWLAATATAGCECRCGHRHWGVTAPPGCSCCARRPSAPRGAAAAAGALDAPGRQLGHCSAAPGTATRTSWRPRCGKPPRRPGSRRPRSPCSASCSAWTTPTGATPTCWAGPVRESARRLLTAETRRAALGAGRRGSRLAARCTRRSERPGRGWPRPCPPRLAGG